MRTAKQVFVRTLYIILTAALAYSPVTWSASVAVVDSGVNPTYPDLVGRVESGADFIDGDSNPFDETPEQHGSTVARIIASIHSQNSIIPIRVLDSRSLSSEAIVIAGVDFSNNSDAGVINLSLGSPSNAFSPALTVALQNSVRAGKLIVIAAGNNGAVNPTFPASLASLFSGAAIAVGALDRNGLIASYSNRAGDSQNYYVVAPGYSNFSGFQGTSFAAPYVSGTAAAILGQNPGLSAQQVAEIILNSADDLGAAGTDAIYGRGRLNIDAALQPQGGVSLPGNDSSGSSSGGLVAGLVIGAGVAAAIIIRNKSLKKAVVVDSYNRPYQINLEELITVRNDGLTMSRMMQNLKRTTEMAQLQLSDTMQMSVWYDKNQAYRQYSVPELEENAEIEDWSMSLHNGGREGAYYALNLNLDPRQFFGLAEDTNGVSLFDRRTLTAPYAGFANSANMAMAGFKSDTGVDVKLGLVSMNEGDAYGVKSKSVLLQGSTHVSEKLRLGVQFSGLDEQGSLFGGAARGAFSVENAGTLAAGFTAKLKLNDKLSIHSIYSQGVTLVSNRSKGLLQQFSGLRSSSYAMGISAKDMMRKGDRVSLTISSPLHVDKGEVTLAVPTGIDFATGNAITQNERLDLASSSRQTDIELGYHLGLGKQSGVAAYMIYRTDPNGLNEQGVRGRYGSMVSFSSRF